MIAQSEITGLVIAGGRGRRLGGRDKGLLPYHGRALILWVLERLEPQVRSVIVSANRHLEQYQAFGWPVLADTLSHYQGPLAGLHSALGGAPTPWILTVPCDAPLLPRDLASRLATGLAPKSSAVAVAHDGERAQYCHALIARSLHTDLQDYLDSNQRSLGRWLERHAMRRVDFSDQPFAFANFNRIEDFSTPLRESLRAGKPGLRPT